MKLWELIAMLASVIFLVFYVVNQKVIHQDALYEKKLEILQLEYELKTCKGEK